MKIEKKIWPKYFDKIKRGEKQYEFRLADFQLNVGDAIIWREWDPLKEKYTGRKLKTKIKDFGKMGDPTQFYSVGEIKTYGIYAIKLEEGD